MAKVFEPEYYQHFSCIAQDCKLSCCAGWFVGLSRAEYNKTRNLRCSPALKRMLSLGVKRAKGKDAEHFYGKMLLTQEGSCYFLGEDQLCRLQKECGEGVLSRTCKNFPRHRFLLPNYIQRGCGNACEAVLQLLLQSKDGLRFVEREDATENLGAAQANLDSLEPAQRAFMLLFPQVQAVCIAILQNRALRLSERILVLGFAMQDLDEARSQGDAGIRDWLRRRMPLAMPSEVDSLRALLDGLPANPNLSVLNALNLSDLMRLALHQTYPAWQAFIDTVHQEIGASVTANEDLERIVSFDGPRYEAIAAHFDANGGDAALLLENAMVNHFFKVLTLLLSEGIKSAWDLYLRFCLEYNFIRTMAISYFAAQPSIEAFIHAIVLCSKRLLHSASMLALMLDQIHASSSDSLAHMAILIRGCESASTQPEPA